MVSTLLPESTHLDACLRDSALHSHRPLSREVASEHGIHSGRAESRQPGPRGETDKDGPDKCQNARSLLVTPKPAEVSSSWKGPRGCFIHPAKSLSIVSRLQSCRSVDSPLSRFFFASSACTRCNVHRIYRRQRLPNRRTKESTRGRCQTPPPNEGFPRHALA